MRVLGLALFLVECSRVVTIQKTDETWERLQPRMQPLLPLLLSRTLDDYLASS